MLALGRAPRNVNIFVLETPVTMADKALKSGAGRNDSQDFMVVIGHVCETP